MSSPTKNEHSAEADTSPKKSQMTERWKYMRVSLSGFETVMVGTSGKGVMGRVFKGNGSRQH